MAVVCSAPGPCATRRGAGVFHGLRGFISRREPYDGRERLADKAEKDGDAPKKRASSKKQENGSNTQDITVLEGLEAVRKRPGMYIGSPEPAVCTT